MGFSPPIPSHSPDLAGQRAGCCLVVKEWSERSIIADSQLVDDELWNHSGLQPLVHNKPLSRFIQNFHSVISDCVSGPYMCHILNYDQKANKPLHTKKVLHLGHIQLERTSQNVETAARCVLWGTTFPGSLFHVPSPRRGIFLPVLRTAKSFILPWSAEAWQHPHSVA